MQVINTNVQSLNAQNSLSKTNSALSNAVQRLSSGLRINSAKDDAAGLAISERFTTQIRGLDVAARNANDGISLAQTAEGALGEISNNLQRVRELAVQSANATNSASDRVALQAEVTQLVAEIDRVASQTSFNGAQLLDGTFVSQIFQVGANSGQTISVDSIASARTTSLGAYYSASITGTAVTAALDDGDLAINAVNINASVAGAGNGQAAGSAYAIAQAINASQSTVVATANATVTATGTVAGNSAIAADTFTINGVNVGAVADGGSAAGQATNVRAAINLVSAATGVVASGTGTDMILTAADGRNIVVGGTVTDTGLTAATTRGTVTLNTTSSAGITLSGTAEADAGFTNNQTQAASLTGQAVSTIDISTVDGATTALATLDAALNTVNSTRANLGAVQNRFSSVIANLQSTSENLTASRSRIRDADFAKETSELTRAQILQQAGTAMLSQANQIPQGVLSLLR